MSVEQDQLRDQPEQHQHRTVQPACTSLHPSLSAHQGVIEQAPQQRKKLEAQLKEQQQEKKHEREAAAANKKQQQPQQGVQQLGQDQHSHLQEQRAGKAPIYSIDTSTETTAGAKALLALSVGFHTSLAGSPQCLRNVAPVSSLPPSSSPSSIQLPLPLSSPGPGNLHLAAASDSLCPPIASQSPLPAPNPSCIRLAPASDSLCPPIASQSPLPASNPSCIQLAPASGTVCPTTVPHSPKPAPDPSSVQLVTACGSVHPTAAAAAAASQHPANTHPNAPPVSAQPASLCESETLQTRSLAVLHDFQPMCFEQGLTIQPVPGSHASHHKHLFDKRLATLGEVCVWGWVWVPVCFCTSICVYARLSVSADE